MDKTRGKSTGRATGRVSIVIPAYNEERHLRACLEAIADQTVQPYEVIVVDNNSTDQTAFIAGSFPFVKVISETHQGIVYARNAGFDAVTGDIIGRIDGDISMPKDWVAHVQAFYAQPERQSVAWSGGGYFYNVRLPRLVSWTYGLFAFGLNKVLTGQYSLWGSNMALTREQWQVVRDRVHLRTDIHEDLDLALHLGEAGYTIAYDAQFKVYAKLRRVHSDRHKLWGYLHWWPRALRIHHHKTWVICWLFGVLVLYVAALFLAVVDVLARLVGKQLPKARRLSA